MIFSSPRRLVAFAAFTIALFLACAVRVAQGQTCDTTKAPVFNVDSAIRAEQDSIDAAKARLDSVWRIIMREKQEREWARSATIAYAGAFGTGVALNAVLQIDRDPGGYHDSFTTRDKWDHYNAAMFLTSTAIASGVPSKRAAVITTVGALLFEFSQGHVSWRDWVAGSAGAWTSVGVAYLHRKANEWE